MQYGGKTKMPWDAGLNVRVGPPLPPEGWRCISPADAMGTGISFHYAMELAELAKDLPDFRDGCTVNADYRRVDGEWFPIPESVRIAP